MRNRTFGFMIVGIAVLIGFIILSFNTALTSIVNTACTHGPDCPMWGTINFQTNVSLSIMIFVIIVGLYLIFFSRDDERLPIANHKIVKEDYKEILNGLDEDGKLVFEKLLDSQGSVFQSALVSGTDFNKVKVTRVLDSLEGKGLIERKRRGMTNIVILKR